MCSARPCWEAIPDPICVLTLLLCRLQACCCCTDGRDSIVYVRDGSDERGDGILGVAGVRRQRLRFGLGLECVVGWSNACSKLMVFVRKFIRQLAKKRRAAFGLAGPGLQVLSKDDSEETLYDMGKGSKSKKGKKKHHRGANSLIQSL